MKSLLKNVLRRISKKQSSKEDNATAFYPQCCAKVDDSARMRIKMSYDQNVKETISSLKTLANDMSSGFVTFKKFQTRRYQYNPMQMQLYMLQDCFVQLLYWSSY